MTQKQNAGDNSTNYQADEITINKGLTVDDALLIAENLFEKNFPLLQEKSIKIVNQRIAVFLKELKIEINKKLSPELIYKFSDPDIQYNLLKIQKKNARHGIPFLRHNLITLLIKRIENDDSDIKKIVINEAIDTIDKLTPNQIKILTLCFLLRHTTNLTLKSLTDFNSKFLNMISFLEFKNRSTDFQHIEYCSCGNMSIGSLSLKKIFENTYKNVFSNVKKPLTEVEIEKKLLKFKNGRTFFTLYKNTDIKHLRLTSVGIVIAILFLEQKTKQKFDLDEWIN